MSPWVCWVVGLFNLNLAVIGSLKVDLLVCNPGSYHIKHILVSGCPSCEDVGLGRTEGSSCAVRWTVTICSLLTLFPAIMSLFLPLNIIFDQRQYNTINPAGVEASGSEIDQMDQNWPRLTMFDLKPVSSCEYWPLDSRPKVESYWKNFTLSSESDNYSMERSTDHGRCMYITAAELSPVMCDVSRSARCHGLSSRPPHGRDRGRCNVTL